MPRRRNLVDYDEDDFDDDYYYEENEDWVEDEDLVRANDTIIREPVNAPTKHIATPGSGGPSGTLDESAALDELVEEFRRVLGDNRIPRDQVDAVLVAADYNVDAAVRILQGNLAMVDAEVVRSLECSMPSKIARMIDEAEEEDVDYESVPPPPGFAFPQSACAKSAFIGPSPDDIIQQKQRAGRARAFSASKLPRKEPHERTGNVTKLSSKQSDRETGNNSDTIENVAFDGANSTARDEKSTRNRTLPTSILESETGSSSRKKEHSKDIRQRIHPVKLRSVSELAREYPSVALVIAGHVDAGKSTLLGHFLRLVGAVSIECRRRDGTLSKKVQTNRQMAGDAHLAWTTDEDQVEQERGVTIDIATRIFTSKSSNSMFSVIDAPGHRDFVPAMILGACQANAALLVVDASIGEFESGFSKDGQTREHAILLRTLGIARLIVVINKMDMVEFAKDRYDAILCALTGFLRSIGWKVNSEVTFLPASGLAGTNLVDVPDKEIPLASWYEGPTLLDALERLPTSNVDTITAVMSRPTRLVVSDAFRSATLGGVLAITGRLVCGTIAIRDRLQICPSSEIGQVKSIEIGSQARKMDGGVVVAGVDNLPISIGLSDIPDTIVVSPGDVLCDPSAKVPLASRFRARVLILDSQVPVVQGLQVEIHMGGLNEAAAITRLVGLLASKTSPNRRGCAAKEQRKQRPRRLTRGDSAAVDITVSRRICVELGSEVKSLERFALRCQGRTIAAGVVTELLSNDESPEPWRDTGN